MKIYIDGSLNSSLSVTGAIPTTDDDLVIGSSIYENFFTGKIDEARVYSRSLTATDITTLYGGTLKRASLINPLVSEDLNNGSVFIYPNPATTKLTVATANENSLISVVGIDGRIVSKFKAETKTTEIDVSGWKKGIYLLYIQTINETIVKKAVIK